MRTTAVGNTIRSGAEDPTHGAKDPGHPIQSPMHPGLSQRTKLRSGAFRLPWSPSRGAASAHTRIDPMDDEGAATRIQNAERGRLARKEASVRKQRRVNLEEEGASLAATAQALASSAPALDFLAVAQGLSADICAAAERFEASHLRHTGAARRDLAALQVEPTTPRENASFLYSVRDVRRNRFFIAERAAAFDAPRPAKRMAAASWSLDRSVWAPRKRTGNSRDYFETSEALSAMFTHDWGLALCSHGLEWHIIKCHHEASEWRDLDRNGVHDEVDEVTSMLFRYHRALYGAFDHYATLYSEVAGKAEGREDTGEADVFNVSFNSYTAFLRDCRIPGQTCSIGELEMQFRLVDEDNRSGAHDKGVDVHNKQGYASIDLPCHSLDLLR